MCLFAFLIVFAVLVFVAVIGLSVYDSQSPQEESKSKSHLWVSFVFSFLVITLNFNASIHKHVTPSSPTNQTKISLYYKGKLIDQSKTPKELGMQDGDELEVVIEEF
jgi:hypothetical protein